MPTITFLNLTLSRDTGGVVAAKVEYTLQFSETEVRGNAGFAERVVLIRRYGETDLYAIGPTSPTVTTSPLDPRDRVVTILADATRFASDLGATIESPTAARSFTHVLTESELAILLEIGRERPYALVSASPIDFRSDVQLAPVDIDVGDPVPSPSFDVGGEPVSLAVDGTYLWVATYEGWIKKFDREGVHLGSIEAGGIPTSIAFDGDKLWVALYEGSVKHLDREGALLRSFPSGSFGPLAIGVSLGRIWIGHTRGELSIFQLDGTPLDQAPRGSADPQSINGTDGILTLVACWGANRVEGYLSSDGFPYLTFGVGTNPWDIAYDSGFAWVTNFGSSSVSIINLNTNIVESFAVSSRPKGIAIGAGAVWIVSSGSDELFQVDPNTRNVVATYSIGQGPERVVFDRDRVFVANRRSRSISTIRVARV